MQDSGGVLTSANPRGTARKSAEDLATKWYKPGEWALYDVIKGGTGAAHESGKADTSRNLLQWASGGEDGPRLPRAGERFPQKILARLGFEYKNRKHLIVDVRRNPYVARWRKAYCWRRSQRVLGEKEFRPRVFLGANFINENLPGNIHARPPRTQGDIVEDLNGGGVGEMWDILNAISDWRDEDGGKRTHLIPGDLYNCARDASIARRFHPCVYVSEPESRANVPGGNCRNPPGKRQDTFVLRRFGPPPTHATKKEKRELAERARRLYQPGIGLRRQTCAKYVGSAARPALVRVIEAMEGNRVPGIFKLAKKYRNTAERTPPYHPEVHPAEFPWARLQGGTDRDTKLQG